MSESEQLEYIYKQLESLSVTILVRIIDEFNEGIPDDEHKDLVSSIYNDARKGYHLTSDKRRVLIKLFTQPRH